MSRNGTRLAVTDDEAQKLIDLWPETVMLTPYPRSRWLGMVEAWLAVRYPASSSADRRLTARSLAPFPLKDGPNVP